MRGKIARERDHRRYYMELAKKAYPEDNPEIALQKYVLESWIPKVKFMYKGSRYFINDDILHFRDKELCIARFEIVTGKGLRLFLNKLQNPNNLQEIDHVTEKILDQIFKYALILPDGFLSPRLVTSNWRKVYSEPKYIVTFPEPKFEREHIPDNIRWSFPYNIEYFDHFLPSLKRRSLHDKNGPYTELTRILRPNIDATLLRTCKAFHELGSEMLYGKNILTFDLGNPSIETSPPSYIGKTSYLPDPNRPIMNDELGENKDVTTKAIRQIQSKAPIKSIPGWCYYDPFIRFLYHIRPHNAAHIKTLRFEGEIKTHICSPHSNCYRCYQTDLISSLRLYIPFINHFCTGLKELILYVGHDSKLQVLTYAQRQREFEGAFGKFLENGIRELKTVRVLTIVPAGSNYYTPGSISRTYGVRVQVHVADETRQWFKERANAWDS
ncbi:hypothetical protein NHQ30_009262 [Ciborinia camelliae]|nr:hypothetical protein NHQ30_009262 [Ciborinia camelliae]